MKSLVQRFKFIGQKPWNRFKKFSLKKKIITVIIFLICGAVGIQIITTLTKKPGYTLTKAERKNITEIVTETGSVNAGGIALVYSPTNGVIENVYISNGDEVKEGQELFTVTSSATEQEAQAAYASYLTAKSSLDAAQANLYALQSTMFDAWDVYKNLAENDTYENSDGTPKNDSRTLPEFHIAQKDWLAAEAKYKNQQSVISQAQAAAASTWLLYQATQNATVKAPASGIASNLSVTNGSTVSINSVTTPTTPVLSVVNPGTTEVSVGLVETDVSKVKPGQKTKIEISAIKDRTYKGIVKRVDMVGTSDQGVIRYNAYIEVTNPDEKIRPGMTADVEITTNELKNVLSVPNSAVKPYQGGRAVRILGKNKKIEYVPVKIGIKGNKDTQILEGITEGQEIISSLSNEQIKRSGGFFGG